MIRRGSRDISPPAALGEAGQINLFWLIHLRWAAALGQVLTILFVAIPLAIELPLGWLFAVVGLEAVSNLGLEGWFRRRRSAGWGVSAQTVERLQVGVMVVDTLLLSALLFLTGGVANPFSVFFAVHVVLAAVLLRPRLAYAGTGFALCCGWALYHWHLPLAALEQRSVRLQGQVVALGVAAAITAFFVSRVRRALELRSTELIAEREHQARADRLEALGTLAAGAAHELASPLSTIAVVAKELELRLVAEGAPEDDLIDARLVREEVARCRRILDRMTLESGASSVERPLPLGVEALLAETLVEVVQAERVCVETDPDVRGLTLFVPRTALTMALRSVLSNALDASGRDQPVHLSAERDGDDLLLAVRDEGTGMDPEHVRRAADPFFTTKEPGRGMGLGLFLTRSVVERLGGELGLESSPGRGTTVSLRLPLAHLQRPAGPEPEKDPRPAPPGGGGRS